MRVLSLPAKLTRHPIFNGLNRQVSQLYLRKLTPWIESRLRTATGIQKLTVRARHSAVQARKFNFLESDLDLSIISEPWTSDEIQKVKIEYEKTKRLLPFLGEPEFYEPWEWQLRQELNQENAALFSTIWNLRKWVWQNKALKEATTCYHRQKAERSIQFIRQELGIGPGTPTPQAKDRRAIIEQLLLFSPNLPKLTQPIQQSARQDSGRSDYLEWELGAKGSKYRTEFYLDFEFPELLRFLAILPGGSYILKEDLQILRQARELPEIARPYSLLCLYEHLLLQSVKRDLNSPQTPADENWKKELKNELTRYLPKNLLEKVKA